MTYAARGPVNRETGAPGGFFLREGHRESGPLDPYLMLSASGPGVVIRLTAPGWQRSSRFSLIVGKPHLGSRLTPQRVVRLSGHTVTVTVTGNLLNTKVLTLVSRLLRSHGHG